MPRFRTVASEVNTVHRLVNVDDVVKASLITQIITSDRGRKKWHYLRSHLQAMSQTKIQRFIETNIPPHAENFGKGDSR